MIQHQKSSKIFGEWRSQIKCKYITTVLAIGENLSNLALPGELISHYLNSWKGLVREITHVDMKNGK